MKYEKPPDKLYRYERVTHYSLGNLANSAFWFAPPASFNDPFDCSLFTQTQNSNERRALEFFERLLIKKTDKLIDQVLGKPGPHLEISDLKKIFNDQFNKKYPTKESRLKFITKFLSKQTQAKQEDYLYNKGVICFSEVHDDILMWSHYASGHRGFCIEFDTSYFSRSRNEFFYRVNYRDEFPSYDPLRIIMPNDEDIDIKELLSPLFTKSSRWGYEREWRLIHNKANWRYGYGNAVSAVYLGAKISHSDKVAIASICDKKPKKPKLYQAKLSNSEYSLEFSEVGYIPFNEEEE